MKRRPSSAISPSADPNHARRLRIIVATVLGTGLLFVLIVAALGLLIGPPNEERASSGGQPVPVSPAPGSGVSQGVRQAFAQVAQTGDADRFAESVALALFAWDTSDGYLPTDYAQSILGQASDPANEETDGLAQDLAGYLPTRAAWIELQRYETRQHLEITGIGVPDAWAEVEGQAREGSLLPGTVAYTVDGTRHRAGIWGGEAVTTEHPVAFTLVIACEPSYDECRLLRLLALDKPLR